MLGNKLVSRTVSRVRGSINTGYNFLLNLPVWIDKNIANSKTYLSDFKFRLSNLSDTNLKLGIYHLHQNNLNDALIRFKLIDKFLNPGDSKANYWLGWTYYLKNNIPKAVYHLEKAGTEDNVNLLAFLRNIETTEEIPTKIWSEYRDMTAEYYPLNFHSSTIHLPLTFIDVLKNQISDLPDEYTVIELGSNIGLLGEEASKRLPDGMNYLGVEVSPVMNELLEIYYPQQKIYKQIITTSISEFLAQKQQANYEIILSFDGLSFVKDLRFYFKKIYNILNQNGYFAFALRSSNYDCFSYKYKQFTYNLDNITSKLEQAGFTILCKNDFLLEINNKYIIVVAKKLTN